MKNHILFFALSIIFLFSKSNLDAQNLNEWENPDVNDINKEPPHAYGFLSQDKANDPLIKSLNGIWKFKWSPDPQSRPVEFYYENYSLITIIVHEE